ncbi:MAG: hypothetical protein CXR31_08565 [Geobacter sp.]|nr:MAG: hypothetical protein CXR31_08565 [Geobacter sp.]
MSEFTNVTVVRELNAYFGGAVTSRTIIFPDVSKKTLGVMQPGEYTFNTGVAETMEILSGELDVKLPGNDLWDRVVGGESFTVAANSSFTMKVNSLTDYCCSYLG